MFRRRTLMALIIVGVVPAFAFVNTLVSAARARREAISLDWARRGRADLAAGRPAAAAEDFETADQYARDRGAYRLQLAEALVAAGRTLEAEAELQTLWTATPGSGTVNLQLARLYAGQGRVTEAVRYYHLAVDGAWPTNAAELRRQARLELARFLLAKNDRVQAQAELVALAGDVPSNPTDPAAARLAGEVAFDTGDYRSARRYLERVRVAGDATKSEEALDDLSAKARCRAQWKKYALRRVPCAAARSHRMPGAPPSDRRHVGPWWSHGE